MKRKLINITHTDGDGIGCGVVCTFFAARHDLEAEVISCGYGAVTEEAKKVLDRLETDSDTIAMVIISDISVKEGTNVDVLINRATQAYPDTVFRLLDHHATAKWLNKYDWAEVSETDENGVKRCGAWMTFRFLSEYFKDYESDRIEEIREAISMAKLGDPDYLNPAPLSIDPLAEYVQIVDSYDTWKWVEDHPADKPFELAADLDKLLKIKGDEEFIASILRKLNELPSWYNFKSYTTSLVDSTDEYLIKLKALEIQRQLKQKEREMVLGTYRFKVTTDKQREMLKKHFIEKYAADKNAMFEALKNSRIGKAYVFKVGVVYCNDNLSEIGNGLAKSHPELDFIILIGLPSNISYRSCKELEVPLGIIANAIGDGQGGGHPQSSGSPVRFRTSRDLSEKLIPGLITK